ncbi:MAG: Tetratricopeptide repeat [Deltaproteobacteria bacterium]|nr:Tetratricopeptide repeat [Deltaproteobacteria bacterium]
MDCRRPRVRWGVFALVGMALVACGTPLMGRFVSVKVVKAPEVNILRFRSIGVVPFRSPERNVGARLADDLVRKLNREPPSALLIPGTKDVPQDPDSLRRLAKIAEVQVLLVGEITEYSVQVSRDTTALTVYPDFGDDDPQTLAWVTLRENPTIGDTTYPRLQPRGPAQSVQTQITRSSYGLTWKVRLVEGETGATLWEDEISRHLQRRTLPGSPVDADALVVELQRSMVQELVQTLTPREATAERMLRAIPFYKDPKAVELVRAGIEAAAQDDWKRAERSFEEAALLVPDAAAVHGNLGVVYERSGRLMEAYAAYRRAYACQPGDPTYRYYGGDLQIAFTPDLQKEDLPTLVLGVRADGLLYLDGGREARQRLDDSFMIYRTEVRRDVHSGKITEVREVEFARGKIVEVFARLSLGQVLLRDPEVEFRAGDLVRLTGG